MEPLLEVGRYIRAPCPEFYKAVYSFNRKAKLGASLPPLGAVGPSRHPGREVGDTRLPALECDAAVVGPVGL